MNNSQTKAHPKGFFVLSISRGLERASYYGIRSLLLLYLIRETINMPQQEALSLYGWFTSLVLVSKIIGAIIGDLKIGSRNAIIAGIVLQSIGAFSLCIPNTFGVYAGMGLLLLGQGLYVPNFDANFGKLYLGRTRLIDAGFMVLVLSVNIGAFLGPLLIGGIGDIDFTYGFIGSGILGLLSLMCFLLVKENQGYQKDEEYQIDTLNIKAILIALAAVGLYWGLNAFSEFELIGIQNRVGSFLGLSGFGNAPLMSSVLMTPFGIVAAILWCKRYTNQFAKLSFGFAFTAASYLLLSLVPGTVSGGYFMVYLLSMMLLAIGEVFITPVTLSVLTQYGNPKYLSILISISTVPASLFGAVFALFNGFFMEHPTLMLILCILSMGSLAVGMLIFSRRLSASSLQDSLS